MSEPKKKKKKLALNKETVRKLTEDELGKAHGGAEQAFGGGVWTIGCSVTGSACGVVITIDPSRGCVIYA